MTTDPLAATASIWSRLPNEANLDRRSPSSTSHSREHPAAAPPSSRSTGAAPSGLAGASPFNASLEFGNPSPRSSVSSSSFASATTPTPESSNSPRTNTTKPLVSPPPAQPQGQHQQRSPRHSSSLALYGQQGLGFNGVRAGPAHEPSATPDSWPSRRASVSFASSYAQGPTAPSGPFSPPLYSPSITSPPPSSQAPPTSSASNSNQPLLAEIFSGNPRPHYRTSTSFSHSSSQPSPRSDGHPQVLLSPSLHHQQQQQESRSYFSAPPQPLHGRGRSQSSAPAFDNSRSSQGPTSPRGMSSPFGAPGNGSQQQQQQQQQQQPQPQPQPADQHGWRPSSSIGPGSALHFSASLPTASAVGSPSLSAFANGSGTRDLSSSPSSRTAGSGNGNGYSPFSPPSLASPSSTSRGSGALSHSFSTGWEDFEREREGRARFRDQWSAAGGNVGGGGGGSSRDLSVGASSSSAGTSTGIGLSNMSPFSRDGARATLAGGPEFPSSFGGDGTWGAPTQGGASAYKARREYSLGAVGTGRKRSDSAWGTRERTLKEQDEDEEGGGDGFAPPTKSGATSRRHSFAAFEQPSVLGRNQTIGFQLPEEPQREPFGNGFSIGGGGMGRGLRLGGLGSSAINDDDLAADLNSLHLSLDAHAKEQQQQQPASLTSVFPHVGSMPAGFPPARSSRRFESSRSPPLSSARSSALPPPSPAKTTSLSLHGSSPRATAEPFTPSYGVPSTSSSAASRFLMSPPAPAPLPPTTTTATATASTGTAASRFDFGGQAQQQQRYGLPPPVPSPATQHPYFSAVAPPPPPPSQSRGPGGPPPLGSTFSPFAPGPGQPYHSPSLPPPHVPMAHNNAYFAPPPPPTHLPLAIPALPPSATSLTAQSQSDMNLGRGVPLHAIPPEAPLCIVGFKAGRKDLFFCEDPSLHLEEGDLVIVEADRGRDVGKYLKRCTVEEVQKFQQHLVELALGQLANPTPGGMGGGGFGRPGGGPGGSGGGGGGAGPAQLARMTKECQPKRIYAKAGPADTHALLAKAQDEVKALALVRSKVAQKGLPMEILDAEWQWDRRKLTFYYTSDQRVDFRELVRELFRIWKTRVWLCCLDQQQPSLEIA